MIDAAFEVSEGFVSSLLGESEELVLASISVFDATALLNPLELDEASESVSSEEAVNKQDITGKLIHLAYRLTTAKMKKWFFYMSLPYDLHGRSSRSISFQSYRTS